MRALAASLLVVVLALSGCSGDSDDSGASASGATGATGATEVTTQAGPDLPACDDVWVLGQKLPEDYRGCVTRTGDAVASTYMNCGTYDDTGDEEYLYWFEDGPLRYVAWSSTLRDYPVEWDIEDGNVIGTNSGVTMFETAMETCREG